MESIIIRDHLFNYFLRNRFFSDRQYGLEKAFDTVSHKRLISKLLSYSVNSKLIKWVKAFLNDRHFRVRVNGEFSSWFAVLSGIPQGSIGPLLFIIYINDLPDVRNSLLTKIYVDADDTKMYRCIHDSKDSYMLQSDINKVKRWADRWLLRLNISRCESVTYTLSRDLRIVFFRSNRISNRIGRPIRFRIESSNRISRIYHASRNTA